MVQTTPFALDDWIRKFKLPRYTIAKDHVKLPGKEYINNSCELIIDTCVQPLSLDGLSKLVQTTDQPDQLQPVDSTTALIYGSVLGQPLLSERIRSLYDDSPHQLFLSITQGAISANFLVLDTILGPGDHVICQYPTYQQLYEVPRRAGAEVSLWRTKEKNSWIPDPEDLSHLARDNTKMIIINNPTNPTGATIPKKTLEGIVEFASKRSIVILCDEVFRPLFHDSAASPPPPSILSFSYPNVIATSSMSKAYSLPGIRLGWIASPNEEIIHQVTLARDYTTISVSQVDQQIAAFALGEPVRQRILERSHAICQQNLALLDEFIQEHARQLSWVKPNGGSSAFVKIITKIDGQPEDDKVLVEKVIKETGLLIVPGGYTFGTEGEGDFRGYLRIGFVCDPEVFRQNLGVFGQYLRRRL